MLAIAIAGALERIQHDFRRGSVELQGSSRSVEHIRNGWRALSPYLRYRDLRVLPLMLEKCPDLVGRVELWNCLTLEFGVTPAKSRISELRRFMQRLDVVELADRGSDTGGTEVPAAWAGHEQLSFVEVLGGALHAHYIASGELYTSFVEQLAQHGVAPQDPSLAYLQRGAELSSRGLECACQLASRYIITRADQELWEAQVAHHLRSWQVLQ